MQITMASARVNAGYSQTELSGLMGVTQATLVDWEKGRKIPRADRLLKFCELCGCEVKDIKFDWEKS